MDTRSDRPTQKQLARFKPGALYLHAISWIDDLVSIYDGPEEFEEQFDAITEAQGLLWAASWCQGEVSNGGFHQFFFNPTGVLAPEAFRGFEMLGVEGAAQALSKAMLKFSVPFPRDRKTRYDELTDLEGTGEDRADWDPFNALDSEFYQATGIAEFPIQADAFVRENMEQFFK